MKALRAAVAVPTSAQPSQHLLTRLFGTPACISTQAIVYPTFQPQQSQWRHRQYRDRTIQRCHRRSFVTLPPNPFSPLTESQTLTASRTLPYAASDIYSIIADVGQYSSFLPFCKSSSVTRWSAPDSSTGKRWPDEAKLVIGWQHIEEEFYSRIYCVPGQIVEAVGGTGKSKLPREAVAHHYGGGGGGSRNATEKELDNKSADQTLIKHLLTRWTVRSFPQSPQSSAAKQLSGQSVNGSSKPKEQTEVTLAIEFQFASPVYTAMSATVMPLVAGKIIEAFEKRVVDLLDEPA